MPYSARTSGLNFRGLRPSPGRSRRFAAVRLFAVTPDVAPIVVARPRAWMAKAVAGAAGTDVAAARLEARRPGAGDGDGAAGRRRAARKEPVPLLQSRPRSAAGSPGHRYAWPRRELRHQRAAGRAQAQISIGSRRCRASHRWACSSTLAADRRQHDVDSGCGTAVQRRAQRGALSRGERRATSPRSARGCCAAAISRAGRCVQARRWSSSTRRWFGSISRVRIRSASSCQYAPTSSQPPMEIVGVVDDIKESALDTETPPTDVRRVRAGSRPAVRARRCRTSQAGRRCCRR